MQKDDDDDDDDDNEKNNEISNDLSCKEEKIDDKTAFLLSSLAEARETVSHT